MREDMKTHVPVFTADALLTLPSCNLRPALHCTKIDCMEGAGLQKGGVALVTA